MRLLLALLVCCGPAAADWDEAHRRFRAAYRKDATPAERRAALAEAAKEDVPQAAELLFNVWGFLERDAGRQRKQLFKVRSKILDLKRQLKKPGASRKIRAQLKPLDADDVRLNARLAAIELEQAAILKGLRGMRAPAVLEWMAMTGLRHTKSIVLTRVVARKLATAKEDGTRAILVALDKLKRAEQIVPLLQALAAHGKDVGPGLPSILKHLGHNDWAVRVAAAHAVAGAAQAEGVAPLVRALAQETPGSRAQREVARALGVLTGQNLGTEPRLWERWWRDHEAEVFKGTVELGRGKPKPKSDQGRFYGIPQAADRIIYVLDKSGSMEVSMRNPRWDGNAAIPADDDEDSRYDAAARELKRAAGQLRAGARYAVLLYSSHVEPLYDELKDATRENHLNLVRALDRTGPEGSTNVYEALDLALRLAGVHPDVPRGPAKADVIYLISDGAPTDAKGKREDPERTLQAVRSWNGFRRVAIHTIGIGREHNAAFLQQLAAENGGEYLAVRK